jgi:hypothetical protein
MMYSDKPDGTEAPDYAEVKSAFFVQRNPPMLSFATVSPRQQHARMTSEKPYARKAVTPSSSRNSLRTESRNT